MNLKIYEIESKLNQKMIDENEAKRLKKAVVDSVEYYSRLDGATKFLSGVGKANIYLILANFAGSMLIQVLNMNVPFMAALKILFSIFMVMFLYLLFLYCL